jgi:G3E family GTPase
MQHQNPVPVVLVTGFLNSGKSTVISHLLSSIQKNFALVTNNFRQHTSPNGPSLQASLDQACLCCSEMRDVLASQLTKWNNNADFIIIESYPTCRVRKIAKMINEIPGVK